MSDRPTPQVDMNRGVGAEPAVSPPVSWPPRMPPPSGGDPGAVEQSKAVASDVAEHAKDGAVEVGQAVAGGVGQVTGQAKAEAKDLVHEVRLRLVDEVDTSTTNVAELILDTGRQLSSMATGTAAADGPAVDLVRELGQRAERLGERLQHDGYRGVTRDLTAWARRNPGTFLLAAGTAGFLVGRLVRNTDTSRLADAARSGADGDDRNGVTGGQVGPATAERAAITPAPTPALVDLRSDEPVLTGTPFAQGAPGGPA